MAHLFDLGHHDLFEACHGFAEIVVGGAGSVAQLLKVLVRDNRGTSCPNGINLP